MPLTEVGVEPTESRASHARRFSVCVPGRNFTVRRSCRSRYRAGRAGLMKASWAPAAPAIFFVCSDFIRDVQVRLIPELLSDQREIRTPTPYRHDVLSVACLPFHHLVDFCLSSPHGIRTRIAGSKVQHPAVRRTGHVICVRRIATRRSWKRSHKVGREALESSSTVLQTVAKPSQLPTRLCRWSIWRKDIRA